MTTKAERLARDHVLGRYITFYHHENPEYGYMSSFSRIPVIMPHPWLGPLDLALYETREHQFQANKATSFKDHEYVRTADTAYLAKQRGRQIQLRSDWGDSIGDMCYMVMVDGIYAVCAQHPEVRESLIATGKLMIYEDSPVDDIWGWRYSNDHRGKNLLGLGWMHVRAVITAA